MTGLRAVVLVLTFSLHPNLNFLEISGLREISAWGDTYVVAVGEKNPWTNITHFSGILFLGFVLVATVQARRGVNRRRATIVGCSFAVALLGGVIISELLNRGLLPIPLTVSFLFLIVILVIAHELSRDLVRAAQLSRDLRTEEERLSLATSAANLGVWEWDMTHDRIWATGTTRAFFDIDDAETVGLERFHHAIHPDDRERIRSLMDREIAQGQEFQVEYRVISGGGGVRWLVSRGRVENDGNGRPFLVRGVTVDVSERKAVEDTLQRQRSELTHVQRISTVGQLSSTLAHELSQPLGAILRNAEAGELFLQENPPDLEELRAILSDIISDDRRAGEVIERMRSLLKFQEPKYESLAVRKLIDQVAALIDPEVQSRGARLEVDCPTGLPPARGDRVQVQQVILNLILNGLDAIEGLPVTRRRLEIRVCLSGEDELEFAVSDGGHGIRPGEESRLFEPFRTTKAAGLGMGLAISQTIIEAHGGRIWAENNPETGAVFRFSLKRASE